MRGLFRWHPRTRTSALRSAAYSAGQTTLKTFFKESDHVRLQPANPSFSPIIVRECKIQGIVRGVVRRY